MVNVVIYAYVMLWPLFNQYVLLNLGAGIPDITPQILIVPGLALIVFLRTSKVEFGSFFAWMILYLLYSMLSVLFNSVPSVLGVFQLLVQTYFLPYLIYFIIYNSRKTLNFKMLALANIACASIIAGVGVAEFIAGTNLIGKVDYDVTRALTLYRTNGPFHDSIGYASLLLPYLSYIYYCRRKELISASVALVSSVFVSFGSFVNFSRAAILGLLVTHASNYAKKNVLLGMAVLAVIAIPMFVILSDLITSLLSSGAVQQRTDVATMSSRWLLYNHVLDVIVDNPLFGIGYDNYIHLYGGATHNSFLQVFAEVGVIGFILFLLFIWKLVFTTVKDSSNGLDEVVKRTIMGIIFVTIFISNTIVLLHSQHFMTALLVLLASINAYQNTENLSDNVVSDVNETDVPVVKKNTVLHLKK